MCLEDQAVNRVVEGNMSSLLLKRFKNSSDYSRVFVSMEKNLIKNALSILKKYPAMSRSEAYKLAGEISKEVSSYYY